jgi:hypothetical protein
MRPSPPGTATTVPRKHKGTCDNRLSIRRREIEGRVLEGLKERLLAPDPVAAFVEGVPRRGDALKAERAHREEETAELDWKIAAILRAIMDGLYEQAIGARLAELKDERDR